MEKDHRRWRFRISTLMLPVIIAALATTLVVDRWKRRQEEQRLVASLERALAEARLAEARSLQAQTQARKAIVRARDSVRSVSQNPQGEEQPERQADRDAEP
jgi:hypothetical protein